MWQYSVIIILLYFDQDPVLGRGKLVTDVSLATDKVEVTTSEGHTESFDGVVITIPVPQLLQIKGDVPRLIGKL